MITLENYESPKDKKERKEKRTAKRSKFVSRETP